MKEIIFADGEFPGLRADGIEFLSIALIKESGEELYLEIEVSQKIHEWTEENILPFLDGNPIPKEEAKKKILEFIGPNRPYFLSYVNTFDWMGVCALFGVFDVPFFWIPLDFASILFGKGMSPEMKPEALAKKYEISLENHKKHHALDDARLLRKVYFKVMEDKK